LNLKRLIVPGIAAGAIAVAMTVPITAEDGVITTTVTPLVLSVSVDEESVNYGSLEFSAANDDRETALSQMITATNDSSVIADLRIRGSDASPANTTHSTWQLNCAPGETGTIDIDQYVHRFALGPTYNFFDTNTSESLCDSGSALLQSGLAASGAGQIDFKLQWSMPLENPTGGYSARSSNVTIIAVTPGTP
jgi:hypothetical protein